MTHARQPQTRKSAYNLSSITEFDRTAAWVFLWGGAILFL